MPQNTTVSVPSATWTQLTDADVNTITFQNISGYHVLIKATTSASAPTSIDGSIRYNPGQGERNVAMSDLFPGISGADRLWAYTTEQAEVFVSHA